MSAVAANGHHVIQSPLDQHRVWPGEHEVSATGVLHCGVYLDAETNGKGRLMPTHMTWTSRRSPAPILGPFIPTTPFHPASQRRRHQGEEDHRLPSRSE
jgi:hypothetical protein